MNRKYSKIADKIIAMEEKYKVLSDEELRGKTNEFKERLSNGEKLDKLLPEAYAVVREAATRTLGMTHFKVQLIGGIVLNEGKIAEMKTGEGKTLVATCPAYLNALTGKGVHIITVNDYLARVNKEQMSKVFNFLGLTTACLTADTPLYDRRKAYACDIVYGTNKEFGFDYLRDNMVKNISQKSQRGFNYAIVDEADSVLIDEARTPLIISGSGDKSVGEIYKKADTLAKRLVSGIDKDSMFEENDEENADFLINHTKNTVHLTDRGVAETERAFGLECLGDVENSTISHCVMQAIRANYLMEEGKDYIVKKGEVVIVDSFTGRLMDGRRFNDGLHQALEAKEGVTIQEESSTYATVTLQNFFRMYDKLSGMTGTAATERAEFRNTYNMDVVIIPTNKPVIRKDLPDIMFKTEDDKYEAIAEAVVKMHRKGQPVLIGTSSITQSERLSEMFRQRKIKHQVLNAKQLEREAEIIAQAGKSGAVTIATNMAGRGTDILLGGNPDFLAVKEMIADGYKRPDVMLASSILPTADENILKLREEYEKRYNKYKAICRRDHKKVVKSGGLCVIGTERADAVRVDNQLRGRAGRQGDPGQSQFYISLEDRMVDLFSFLDEDSDVSKPGCRRKVNAAQKRVEAQHYEMRKNVLEYDDVTDAQRKAFYKTRDRMLSYTGYADIMPEIAPMAAANIVKANLKGKKITEESLKYINRTLCDMVGNRNSIITSIGTPESIMEQVTAIINENIENKKALLGDKADDLIRIVMIAYMDKHWMRHIENMNALRQVTSLTGYGNIKPIDKYKKDAYILYKNMFMSMEEDILHAFFHIKYRFNTRPLAERYSVPGSSLSVMEQDAISDLTHNITMQCIEQGRMLSKEEIDLQVAALARQFAFMGRNDHHD